MNDKDIISKAIYAIQTQLLDLPDHSNYEIVRLILCDGTLSFIYTCPNGAKLLCGLRVCILTPGVVQITTRHALDYIPFYVSKILGTVNGIPKFRLNTSVEESYNPNY